MLVRESSWWIWGRCMGLAEGTRNTVCYSACRRRCGDAEVGGKANSGARRGTDAPWGLGRKQPCGSGRIMGAMGATEATGPVRQMCASSAVVHDGRVEPMEATMGPGAGMQGG